MFSALGMSVMFYGVPVSTALDPYIINSTLFMHA